MRERECKRTHVERLTKGADRSSDRDVRLSERGDQFGTLSCTLHPRTRVVRLQGEEDFCGLAGQRRLDDGDKAISLIDH